jgi:hypothetical protein
MADTGGHRLVVVVTLVAVLCLVPAAHGSPPDPTWIAGLCDNADFDDVVFLITNTLGVAERSVGCSLCPRRLGTSTLLPTDSDTRPLSFRSSALSRAPPVGQIIVVGSTNAGIFAPSPWSLTRLPRIDIREAIPRQTQLQGETPAAIHTRSPPAQRPDRIGTDTKESRGMITCSRRSSG